MELNPLGHYELFRRDGHGASKALDNPVFTERCAGVCDSLQKQLNQSSNDHALGGFTKATSEGATAIEELAPTTTAPSPGTYIPRKPDANTYAVIKDWFIGKGYRLIRSQRFPDGRITYSLLLTKSVVAQ